MLEPSEYHLLTRFLDFASEEDFVEDGVDLLRIATVLDQPVGTPVLALRF